MRVLWSLAKYILFLAVILCSAGAALFWLPTGSQIIQPLTKWAVEYFFPPLKFNANISGSIHDGYKIRNLNLISDDTELLKLDYFAVSPDWNLVLNGLDGLPFISTLELDGVSTDLEKVNALVNFFTPESSDEEVKKEEDENSEPFNLKLTPFNLSATNIFFGTPQIDLALEKFIISPDGNISLKTNLISQDNILPIQANALLNFDTLDIPSSDLKIGQGSGILKAKFFPLASMDIKLFLTALQLDDFIKFSPQKIDATGRLDAKLFYDTNGASGVVSMPRAKIMDVPLKFRLPFDWDGANKFAITNADLKTGVASFSLNSAADISNMHITANGNAENISLREIGKIFAPNLKLEGENGFLKFDLDMIASGDILNNIDCDLNAKLPFLNVMGMKILNDFKAHALLKPGDTPKISLDGKIFNGKLFARGEAKTNSKGEFLPQAVVSIVNLDLPTVINTIPDLKKSVSKPYGKITAKAVISEKLDVNADINSDRISANGITITNTKGEIFYSVQENRAAIENFSFNIGKTGAVKSTGYANLNDGNFKFFANARNIKPNEILKELKDLAGVFNVDAQASGNYNDVNNIEAAVRVLANNMGYSGMNFGNLDVPANYSRNQISIPNARAQTPGGNILFRGNFDLKQPSNPNINMALTSSGIDLAKIFKAFKLDNNSFPVNGNVRGVVNVIGKLDTAKVFADITASNIKAGDLVHMPTGNINVEGDMKEIKLKKLYAQINKADLNASGNLKLNQQDIMKSDFNFEAKLKNFLLDPMLKRLMGSAPVTGMLDAHASAKGTFAKPELNLNVDKPLTVSNFKIQDIAVKLTSPAENNFKINAGAKTGTFKANADIDLKNNNGVWIYNVVTKPMDLKNLVDSVVPAAAGMVGGKAVLKVDGNSANTKPININLNSDYVSLLDKIKIENINIPVTFDVNKNFVNLKDGRAVLSEGKIRTGFELDLNKKAWTSSLRVRGLNFGKLAQPFLPEGELIGSADLDASAKGTYGGVWPTSYANGKFRTGPGYLHKMSIIDRISPTKRISFENIKGSFFWNGTDLYINQGTQATASYSEPLYRYVSVNGACGIPGKGLNLLFDGRFDLKILDQLLGAMKGVFQYMTGGIARNVIRDTAGRILGLKTRDFQNVSFRLANNWNEIQLLDLAITKAIEDFLPLDILNRENETQRDDKQFKLSIKIPTGKGDKSIEEESATDQFKEQLLDNLLNLGL